MAFGVAGRHRVACRRHLYCHPLFCCELKQLARRRWQVRSREQPRSNPTRHLRGQSAVTAWRHTKQDSALAYVHARCHPAFEGKNARMPKFAGHRAPERANGPSRSPVTTLQSLELFVQGFHEFKKTRGGTQFTSFVPPRASLPPFAMCVIGNQHLPASGPSSWRKSRARTHQSAGQSGYPSVFTQRLDQQIRACAGTRRDRGHIAPLGVGTLGASLHACGQEDILPTQRSC
jgi:hypothetical protein